MKEVKLVEEKELIAERVPPGDKWELVIDRENIIDGLVPTLTQYMRKTKYKGHYRLEPLNGKLYALRQVEVVEEKDDFVFDLYGEDQPQ